MLEPTEFIALVKRCITRHIQGAVADIAQQPVERMQANAGHQHRRHRHQCHRVSLRPYFSLQQGSLVFAKKFFNPLQSNRVDVPGVPGKILHPFQPALVRCMETVVHGRSDAYGHEPTVMPMSGAGLLAQQIFERIGKAFGLKHLAVVYPAQGTDNAVTRTGQCIGRHIHGSGTGFELADKTVVQAVEMRFAGFGQVQIGETSPDSNRCIPHPRMA